METLKNYDKNTFVKIQNNKNVLLIISFYASWCGPCKTMEKNLINFLKTSKFDNVFFLKCNIDEHRDLTQQYNINSIPTLVFFKNGKEIDRNIGLITEEELNKTIIQLL